MKRAPWHQLVAATVCKHVLIKSIGTPLFIGVFLGLYFYLLKHPAFPTTVMPTTWVDRLIPFQPWTLSLYFSLWAYVSLPPGLLATRRELAVYTAAIAGTCIAALMIFYFWPTVVPPADIDWTLYPLVNFLKEMDASGNAFPSLHVATAVFSGIWLHYLLRGIGGPWWILILNALWCAGIVYSTLATRQHVTVDVWGGLVLGMLPAIASVRYHIRMGAQR